MTTLRVGTSNGDTMEDRQALRAAEFKRFAEWPTLVVLGLTYLVWAAATVWVATWSVPLAIVLCALAGAQHSSLTHEALHGHPFRSDVLNAALVFPALTMAVPYLRFRDTHLAHHHDEVLTDPYDDPETNYLDPAIWAALPAWRKALHRWNNTLAGRLIVGPILGQIAFMRADWLLIRQGEKRVISAWLWHIPAVGIVVWWMLSVAQMPLWAWALSVYLSLSILKLRTYLEHQAHDRTLARTAIVEDCGILSILFLYNNLHVVHHMHPGLPWYALPRIYADRRSEFLSQNEGYRYGAYSEIFRKYLFRAKDPVPHPLYPDGHQS
ncbi:fatty acid desaturase [Marivita hallyeonensis]|uniref:Fatty acid desaturase n=1 Tax=Marivita hallyeonensis TaxID=996342 RepID=A0A1M5X2G0_9RHOB|nr:fatty acid desaturase [Marivita hallyeonensis]SHH93403.1 Fatty acid desaturase [Marivita hallyeonensis]